MRREALLLAAAIQFLTRLPVPPLGWEPDRLARAMRYFPLTGALVGAVSGAVLLAASATLPAPVAAGLALAAGIWLTGALHEDGLADTADALGGHVGRDKALEIMRDSRIGTYGAAALVLSIGLRWAALASVPATSGALMLIAAGATGRAMMVPVSRISGYARPTGAGGAVASPATGVEIALALLTAIACCLLLGAPGTFAFAFAAIAAWLVLRFLLRRLGGYTGDGLGAIEQAAEVTVMIALAGALA
ncbi:adenosylcobinamide-GDP ribazoletransferase [Rhodobacteraceae bacterium NNCM2]|nr:adenosylcobinamide-GDP ribazoletransferase [Coraliihabitans acroporae]